MITSSSDRRLRILHVILAVRPTNEQYNEHCLPMIHKREIAICTYFKSEITPPAGITLFDGDNSLRGFFRAARSALRDRDYDVIHVHTPHAGLLLLMALLRFGLYRKLIPSTVLTVHNSFQNFKLRNQIMFLPSFLLYRRVVFCSYSSFESFPAFYRWLASGRMNVVQNAVDLERIDRVRKETQAAHSDRFTIATVGLIRMKNPLTVLDAFRRVHDQASSLVFIGEGNLRAELAREVEKAGMQKQVEMTGMIARDSVFEHFTRADTFLSASWGEGLPVAVLEAMACGCPVILSDIPPHREITEGVDFIPLVQPGDAAGFAGEIKRFMEMPVSERAGIGQNCRNLVEERFSLPAMHAGYERVYAQIVGKRIPLLFESIN